MIDFQIPIVGETLGGSFIWEEYKGNFAQARSVALPLSKMLPIRLVAYER